MLPGFRFLFGAIVLCFSILVFGLGAAALFRAAHEEFASRPSWRATPGTMLAQQNDPFAAQQSDPSRPVLALLEVEDTKVATETSHDSAGEPRQQPSEGETTAAETDTTTDNPADAPKPTEPGAPGEPSPMAASEPARDAPAPPEPEMAAHLEPGTAARDGSAAVEPVAPPVVASDPETTTASLDVTPAKTVEPSTAATEPINAPAAGPEPTAPAPQIAALGSAAATDIQAREKDASNETRAKAYRNFIKHRLRAQRVAKARRRLAHRARIVRRAEVQQQPTFQQPTAAFTTAPGTPNFSPMENPHRF